RYAAGSGARLCKAWEEIEQFTVCGIEGFAIGGGLALAVALDYRIIGESTHMRAPEAALGLSMSWGSVPRLVNLIGPARTKQILIHANHRISGTDALNWGLVQEIVSDGDAEAAAVKAAEKAADIPPVAARMIKHAVNAYANALADAVVHMDTDQVLLAESGHDHLEAVDAFLAKRDPTFTGA
ncbi:MAG: enoyl-CoA hydratase/isomerase family protein, partial [Alphaproteobacteria bacterium]